MHVPAGTYFRGHLVTPTNATGIFLIPLFDGNGNVLTIPQGQRPIISALAVSLTGVTGLMSVGLDTNGDGTLGQSLFAAEINTSAGNIVPYTGEAALYGKTIGAAGSANPINTLVLSVPLGASVATCTLLGVLINS